MISIINTRIYTREGDHCTFRVAYRNEEGIFDFKNTDSLTMILRNISDNREVLVKSSELINTGTRKCTVFSFSPGELIQGDFKYDLILHDDKNHQHTLIDGSYFNVLKSINYSTKEVSDTPVDSDVCIYDKPLVCDYPFRLGVEDIPETTGDIILF